MTMRGPTFSLFVGIILFIGSTNGSSATDTSSAPTSARVGKLIVFLCSELNSRTGTDTLLKTKIIGHTTYERHRYLGIEFTVQREHTSMIDNGEANLESLAQAGVLPVGVDSFNRLIGYLGKPQETNRDRVVYTSLDYETAQVEVVGPTGKSTVISWSCD